MANPPNVPASPQEALDFIQKMWNPLGIPMPGFMPPGTPGATPGMPWPNPMMMFATLDPAEIDKKIMELRVVENWLTMSLSFMQMSIKTLELQKVSIEAIRAGTAPPDSSKGSGHGG